MNFFFFFSAAQVPRLNFEPTPEFPALQYFGELEKGGEAETKGVRAGDFILEVSQSFWTCRYAKAFFCSVLCYCIKCLATCRE